MNTPINPASVAPPVANYSHAMLSVAPGRLLHTSGVVPTTSDGRVPTDLGEQALVVWSNITNMLEAAGMTVSDIVSITTYVVQGQDLADVMAARDRAMAGHKPASTLLVVPALARPEWLMEIAVVAAA
ncbi:MAG: 2-iminobutanoate/2-iminopropanoate deaminase [Acidimicrobiia bacterium]|jgi:enamine deaminase RidA (YjgF/YER057c/UK114 family)|nr:2-iminobutanoate/2-iminopropanoate deaminase [Acidimicrobiia bacterium]